MPLSRALSTEEADPFLQVEPRPSAKLRGRIMAAGYRYKILNEHNEEVEDFRTPGGQSCCNTRGLTVSLALVCLLFMALLTAFLLVLAGEWGLADKHGDCNEKTNACLTPGCVKTSSDILSKMDFKVDPCTDMYHYACGGWMKHASIPPGWSSNTMFVEATDKVNHFLKKFLDSGSTEYKGRNLTSLEKLMSAYKACMDKETIDKLGITPVVELINTLGSWTVAQGVNNIKTWDSDQWVLQERLEAAHSLWSSALFTFSISVDAKNTSQRTLEFSQSGITLSNREAYFNKNSKKFEEGFLDYATQVAVLLGGDAETAREKMRDVYNLEKELAKVFLPYDKMTNPMTLYNKMTLKEFQAMIGSWINMKTFLRAEFGGRRQFSDTDNIIVVTPSFFKNLSSIVQNTSKEVLANYLMWNTLQKYFTYLPDSFYQALLPLLKLEIGISGKPQRWETCVSYVKWALGFAASAVYVDAKFSASDKAKVEKIIENFRQNFIDNLANVPWLDDVTRSRLREKAEAVYFSIGYPDWILDPDQLDEYYEKFEVKEDAFFENRLSYIRFESDKDIDRYGLKPDKTEWRTFPSDVNGYNSPLFNMVMMPAAILQPPFFSPHFPKPFLYSTIGMVVGHELTHSFDNAGRMYDKNGNLGKQQWTPEVVEMYKSHAKCMEDQYSQYTIKGIHLNGKTTLNENIADNGAVRLAYSAFQRDNDTETFTLPGVNLTQHQMFFLGFAQIMCGLYTPQSQVNRISTDEHSNSRFRVRGVLSNIPEFSEVFNCPKQEKEVCRIW